MKEQPYFIDSRTLFIYLMKARRRAYLYIGDIQAFLEYLYQEIHRLNHLDRYRISYNINFGSIEWTVIFNKNILGMSIDEDAILLRRREKMDYDTFMDSFISKYQIPDEIVNIINSYCRQDECQQNADLENTPSSENSVPESCDVKEKSEQCEQAFLNQETARKRILGDEKNK